jgi:hypothetical protein
MKRFLERREIALEKRIGFGFRRRGRATKSDGD